MGAGTRRWMSRIASIAVVFGVGGTLGLVAGGFVPAKAGAGNRNASGAVAPSIEMVTPVLRQGGSGALDIDALGAHACRLSFSGPAGRHAGPFVVHVPARHVQWHWRVPANATRGAWAASATCAASSRVLRSGHSARLVENLSVVGGRAGASSIVAIGSLRSAVSRSQPSGRVTPGGGNVVGVGGASNPFPYGQCTYHAYETRPDVYDYAVAHGVPRGGAATGTRYGGIPDYWWNAWRWLSNAQRVGIPTGTTPVHGALVVFPRGYYRSAVGHIAYVESVSADGSYLVSERNWNYRSSVNIRRIPPSYPGVGFIYGGPAGNGPSTSPPVTTTQSTTTTTPTTTQSTTTTTTTTTTTPVTTTPTTTPPPPPTFYVHHVYGTCADGACGVNERSGPGYSNYAILGNIGEGGEVDIVCQTQGQLVTPNHGTASTVWDRLTNGAYVTDVYVDTSGVGGSFSPPIPQC
jgi:surface antigen